MVAEFHDKYGDPKTPDPRPWGGVETESRIELRTKWIRSECQELEGAKTEAEEADAYLDILYFALGGLHKLRLDADPLFAAVHAANMTKVKVPGVAKVQKPENFKHPDIAALIEEQRKGR